MKKKILILLALSLVVSCTKPANQATSDDATKTEGKAAEVEKDTKIYSFKDEKTGLYGFKNADGKVVLPPQFNTISQSSDDEELIEVTIENKFYRMDRKGNLKFQSFLYDNAWDYYEQGLARFVAGNKIGFHDKKGNIVIAANFDFAFPFKDGFSVVCNGCVAVKDGEHSSMESGKWGAVDLKGKVVIPIELPSQDAVLAEIKKKS